MKNNVLDKIKMQTAKLPSARFNMANDVSLTTQFGCVTRLTSDICTQVQKSR